MLKNTMVHCFSLGLMAGSSSAQWDIVGFHFDPEHYVYNVEGLIPDFDQIRALGSEVQGLPNDGRFYCVPTATANMFAWIANHGFPELNPDADAWDQYTNRYWDETAVERYNYITDNIELMGIGFMGTSATGGTRWENRHTGMQSWIEHWGNNETEATLMVTSWGIDGLDWDLEQWGPPTTENMAGMGLLGAVMILSWGFYDIDQDTQPPTLGDRNGGHVVTLQRVENIGGDEFIRVMNPGSGDSQVREADFSTQTLRVERVGMQNSSGDILFRSAFMEEEETFTDLADQRVKLFDNFTLITPRGGFSVGESRLNFHRLDLSGDNPAVRTLPISLPQDAEVVAADLAPDMQSVVLAARFPDIDRILRWDLLTGQWRTLIELEDPIDVEFTRFRTVMAINGTRLVHINPFDVNQPVIADIDTTINNSHLAYDDVNDRVAVLAADDSLLVTWEAPNLTAPKPFTIQNFTFGADIDFTHSPVDDAVWFTSDGEVHEFRNLDDGVPELVSRDLRPGGYADSVSVDERGMLYVVVDNGSGRTVGEYLVFSDVVLFERFASPYSGFSGDDLGADFRVLHSRTNLNINLYDNPGSHNVDATTLDLGDSDPMPPSDICTNNDFESYGVEDDLVDSFEVDGVDIAVATATGVPVRLRSYGDAGTRAFAGAEDRTDIPFSPIDVSGDWFISASRGSGNNLFHDIQPITFTPSQPIQRFGLTTMDLLEPTVGDDEDLRLVAYDADDNIVAEHTRTAQQGASGVTLFWLVESELANITRIELTGSVTAGGGFGIDDVAVCKGEGCPADLDGDGDTDADDFFSYLDAFASDDLTVCDIDGDGDCDADDFFGYLDRFAQGC